MSQTKYSRQREAILHYLRHTKSHPTANMVYEALVKELPNISLGTIYRNLNLLAENGDIIRLNCGEDTDRFDGDTSLHYHFICTCCHQVSDLALEPLTHINTLASVDFEGKIKDHKVFFYGCCKNCLHT